MGPRGRGRRRALRGPLDRASLLKTGEHKYLGAGGQSPFLSLRFLLCKILSLPAGGARQGVEADGIALSCGAELCKTSTRTDGKSVVGGLSLKGLCPAHRACGVLRSLSVS